MKNIRLLLYIKRKWVIDPDLPGWIFTKRDYDKRKILNEKLDKEFQQMLIWGI